MQISPKNRLQQPLHRRKSTYLHIKQWLVSSTKWRIAGVSLLVILSILLGNHGKSQASNNAIPLLQPTLFADWGMNNDGTDSSGNGRTLTLTGGASYTDTFVAEGTHALDLAGGYASAPTMTVPSEFSISSWVRIPITLTQIQTIIGTDTTSIFTAGFKLYINEYGTSNGKIAFETGVGESRIAATTAENTFTFGQ